MKSKHSYLYFFLALLLLVAVILSGWSISPVYASSGYSSVLTDLQKDSSFNAADYPDKPNDYTIQVIQIAESTGKELFVYTYQPCQNTRNIYATEINMSRSESPDGTQLYGLVPVSTQGVFCKYKVYGVTVSTATTRYYNITSIYRKFIQGIDSGTGNDNVINSVVFHVDKLYVATTENGVVTYSTKQTDTVEILNPYVDFVSYGTSGGWDLVFGVVQYTDIHYVAFSTDKKIDTLKEADVTYTTQPYHYSGKDGEGYTYGAKSDAQYLTLTGEENFGVSGYDKYTWKSIYRSEDFVKTINLKGAAKAEVEKSEFVLVFLTTSYRQSEGYSLMQGHYKIADGTKVSDVTVLRLKFITGNKLYNLGAVMDKQEGDNVAGNKPLSPQPIGFFAYVWRCIVRLFKGTATSVEKFVAVLVLLIVLLVLPVVLTVLSFVFPAFGAVMKTIFKGLWRVISAPFKGIAAIVRRIKEKDK